MGCGSKLWSIISAKKGGSPENWVFFKEGAIFERVVAERELFFKRAVVGRALVLQRAIAERVVFSRGW